MEENKEIMVVKEETTEKTKVKVQRSPRKAKEKVETKVEVKEATKVKVDEEPVVIDLKAQREEMIRSRMFKDKVLVRGIFKFHEIQGGELSFTFRQYKGEQAKKYTYIDGETYTIPLGVARHLNTSGSWPIHEHKLDKDGNRSMQIGKKVRRYGFYPLDFIDAGQYDNQDKNIILASQNF